MHTQLLFSVLLGVNQREGIGGIQTDAEVSIAACSGFVAGQGSEQRHLLDAVAPAPFGQVLAEQGDDLIAAGNGLGSTGFMAGYVPALSK